MMQPIQTNAPYRAVGPGAVTWARVGAMLAAGLLVGCASDRALRTPDVNAAIRAEMATPGAKTPAVVPTRVSDALAEPTPRVPAVAPEPRLDLLVNNAQAREVFLAIVADTRYSMLMHPDVAGTLSVTLRGVTVTEALEAIRDVYGYDFKIDGRRITVFAPTLQTRVFTINYPHAQRLGVSDLRVASGAIPNANATTGQTSNTGSQNDNSRVSTSSRTDLWSELTSAVCTMIGGGDGVCASKAAEPAAAPPGSPATAVVPKPAAVANVAVAGGRSVVISPQAGIMAVRAMPEELRQVEKFLKAAQVSVERQVMLEAKIVEVELRDGYQSGVDWSGFHNGGGATAVMGTVGGGTSNNLLINGVGVKNNTPGFPTTSASTLAGTVALPGAGGGLFGLALATEGFQAVLGFLETRGDVQILSSPRIATMNNQKALLKVGTDEYFVTNVSGGNTATGTTTVTNTTTNNLPTLTLTPFFSGIALDVTPQIDDGVNITLHVRPSVTSVNEKTKQIDLGTIGNYKLPLASSAVNESDTLVRIQDGNIVAIGGLMQTEANRSASGLNGTLDAPFWSSLFGNKAVTGRKKEVIVLIKPTIIRTAEDWEQQNRRARAAIDDMDAARARVIRLDGSGEK